VIRVELVVDTNVVSYIARSSRVGLEYEALIAERRAGVTLLTLMELHYGVTLENWSRQKIEWLDRKLQEFIEIDASSVTAELCGSLRAQRRLTGRPIDIPDAWNAATAIWLGVPLVTHDRDLEGIPGLQVITLHDSWRVGEDHPIYQCGEPRDYIRIHPH
jgi:tRNA(fMet)-specific endonuclease VapC